MPAFQLDMSLSAQALSWTLAIQGRKRQGTLVTAIYQKEVIYRCVPYPIPLRMAKVQLRWVRGHVFYGNKEDKTGVARSFPPRRMFYANIRRARRMEP
jgi:hypothetical protein